MRNGQLRRASWTAGWLALVSLGACTSDPEVHTCVVQEDCPASLSCLQQVCESIALPQVTLLNPEDDQVYPWNGDGSAHTELLTIVAADLVLRPKAESSARVVGDGYLVVFVDEVEVATIDSGDLQAGVQVEVSFDDTPGVHRLRVQARLNDGTDYDNGEGSARSLLWVDDGREHVALRQPWPGDAFSLDSQLIDAEVVAMPGGAVTIAPPSTEQQIGHVHYDAEPFDLCLMEPQCVVGYNGVVPSNEDAFGPVLLPRSEAGMVALTVLVTHHYHTPYFYDDEMGIERQVYSSIQIERTDTVVTPPRP
ncbi:hypothetical protein DB30_06777 [Enhygromyxa salina]|uniref:Lipoprotein n=1 Tax=Enhygromyxa salina TaxID=215803 RepID=A0A0C1ZA00_9BACT|nr:hypothetical protein [Enhygromyxa salina]KIG14434.1 hypothetical protein DB30_06777 [Enhygromyxa salina]